MFWTWPWGHSDDSSSLLMANSEALTCIPEFLLAHTGCQNI